MKNRIFALALIPALALLTAEAWAGKNDFVPAAKYARSAAQQEFGGTLTAGVIRKCTAGTLVKNFNPFISGGSVPVALTETFVVDGEEVVLTVTWDPADNSFEYEFGVPDGAGNLTKAGIMHAVGVENSDEKFIYEYNPDTPVQADSGLNVLLTGGVSEKVNHLDICISPFVPEPVDDVDPVVSIFLAPFSDGTSTGTVDGTTVTGKINIIAEVTDDTDVDVAITITNADGVDVTPEFSAPMTSECDPAVLGCTAYTWGPWDTTLLGPGVYTITVEATEISGLQLNTIETLTVTVSVENCLEGADFVPEGSIGIGGCNPSGYQIVEIPNEFANLLDGKTLTQVAVPALANTANAECRDPNGDGVVEFPSAGRDVRWDELVPGEYNARPLDLSEVFDLAAVVPADLLPGPGEPPLVELRADTAATSSRCFALIFGDANFRVADFYNGTVPLGTGFAYTYSITQLPETPDLGLRIPTDVGPLGPNQIDLQKVPEATYQPTDRFIEPFIGNQLGPFTKEVFNPNRVRVPDFSFYALGTVQICESLLGSGLGPDDGRPYYEAVLQCSTDLAVEYFDDLDMLLAYVGEPSLPDYPQACLVNPSAENLRVDLNRARSMIKVGDWTKATTRLNDLLLDVEQATWLVDDRNCPGHVIMRLNNLLWRTEQLELAESLLPLP